MTWLRPYSTSRVRIRSSMPFLVGERDPSLGAPEGGARIGLTLAHDRASLARSALCGVASYLGLRARALMCLSGVSAAIMSSGSSLHVEWVEVLATMLGIDITVSSDMHLTVRGTARLAARAMAADLPNPPVGRTVAPRSEVDVDAFLRDLQSAAESASQLLVDTGQNSSLG